MKLLLDTHTWLWWLQDPSRLADRARRLLAANDNELFFSAASAWEIAIKWRRGRLRLPDEPRRFVPSAIHLSGVTPLDVTLRHALHAGTLPLHHADPFDRLLVAQAQADGLAILSADPAFEAYGVEIVWT